MFNLSKVEAAQTINKKFINSRLDDAVIFGYYFGPFNLRDTYPPRFRKSKSNGRDTGFYISKSGKLIYNDFGGDQEKLDAFAFVGKLYGLSFKDTIDRIARDFGLVDHKTKVVTDDQVAQLAKLDKSIKKDTKIHFRPKPWDKESLKYWADFHITEEELHREGIYPIKHLYVNERFIHNPNEFQRYAITIPHKDELLTKVLSPNKDDFFKWISNIPLDLPFGVNNLNIKAKKIMVAKAKKDEIIFKKFLPAVISTQNESRGAISEKTNKKLDFHFEKKYLAYDPDEAGLKAMNIYEPMGYIPAHVPIVTYQEHGIKDWSDLAKARGLGMVEKLLHHLKII